MPFVGMRIHHCIPRNVAGLFAKGSIGESLGTVVIIMINGITVMAVMVLKGLRRWITRNSPWHMVGKQRMGP